MSHSINGHLVTVVEAAEIFRNSGSRHSASSQRHYQTAVNKWITPVIGAIPIINLTPDDVTRVKINYQESLSPIGKPHCPWGYRAILVVLRTILNFAFSTGLVPNLPFRFLLPPIPPRPVHFLSASDVVPFLNAVDHICSNLQVQLAIRLMLFLGLRTSEVASLRWDGFRSDFSEVLLGHSLSRVELSLPCPTLIRERLISLRDDEALGCKSTDSEMHPWVFSGPNGNPRFPIAIRRTIQRAAEDIGLDGTWTPQDLRISCMFILSELGVDLLAIMQLMRHRNPRSTGFRPLVARDTLRHFQSRLEQISSDHPRRRLED